MSRNKSLPIPLKYIDVVRTTDTNVMWSKESASMIFGISMRQEICPIIGQISFNLLYWTKTFKQIFMVRGDINEETAYTSRQDHL